MRAWRKVALVLLSVILVVLVLIGASVYVFTQTDWGRERVRRLAVSQLGKLVHGHVAIAGLSGDLLNGAVLTGLQITDSTGAPFVQADSVRANYSVGTLLHKRIDLSNVRLVNFAVVLDRKTGGKWNYERIFPHDTTQPPSAPGFGSWVTLRDMALINGHITVHAPWAPDSTLTARQQDSVVRFNLGPLGRQNITRVGNGFQRHSDFRDVNGVLPFLQWADPSDARQIIDVATLRLVAQPFRPPTVQVVSTNGQFIILKDSLYFSGVTLRLPGTRAAGSGRYNFSSSDLRLRLHADPVATNDLLWIDPDIPHGGTGALDFALDWIGRNSDYVAKNASLKVAGATLKGNLGLLVNDTMTFHDTDLRFAHLDTRTIQQLFPTLKSPRQGYLTGRTVVAGSLGWMKLNADVAFDDPITGRSRVLAQGGLGSSPGAFRAQDLKVTLSPVRVPLGRIFMPSLPVGGVVTGTALLNGSTASRMTVRADLTHVDTTGVSRVVGTMAYTPSAMRGATPAVNADLQLLPLSLATVGRFAPAAGLHGTVSGPVKIEGPARHMVLSANLTTPDGGGIVASGSADLSGREKVYDLTANANLFDASQVTTKSPKTSITADVTVRGQGTDPETLHAVATAHVKASQYDSLTVDSGVVHVSAANGILTVDTLTAQLPHIRANVNGQFGLTGTHNGTLHYMAAIDSLSALSRFVTADTSVVAPRPGILAQRIAEARADSARIARATAVQRAVSGQPMPKLVVDTPRVIRKNTLLGAMRADGTITGNVHTFDLQGTASGTQIVALGNSVGMLSARYGWQHALTPQSALQADLLAANIIAEGFALDTVVAHARYQQPNGTVDLAIHQSTHQQYDVTAAFAIDSNYDDILLNAARLRFDTTVYTATRSSRIRFGSRGVLIDSLEFLGPPGSRVFVNASLPKSGDAVINASVSRFDIANVLSLTQSDIPARGLVSLDLTARGTAENPVAHLAVGAEQFSYGTTPIPEVHGFADYSNQTLTGHFEANQTGKPSILVADGTVPINLALTSVAGSRVPNDRQINAHIVADSLPLDMIPQVTEMVTDLKGEGDANVTIQGTLEHPKVNGRVSLANGNMTVVPTGVVYHDIAGNVRLIQDTVIIDSLVARSAGTFRLAGGIGIQTLAKPSFALALTANDLRVLDNEKGELRVDAKLKMAGPFTRTQVTGTTRVASGYIYIPESNGKTLVGSGDPTLYAVLDTTVEGNQQLFTQPSPLISNLLVNVSLVVNRDVFVRSQEADVEVYTDGPVHVSLDQSKGSLLLDGILLSDRGQYRFQGRQFDIKRGSAVFTNTPGLNPTLQITGQYTVQLPAREAINILIVIAGTLDAPKISLESDAQPPISQTDLLSYLAFGQSSSSLLQQAGNGLTTGGSGSSNIVGQGAAFAARQIGAAALGAATDQFAGQAARSLGADVLTISPADVSLDVSSFLRATQIEFGKYIQTRTFLSLQVRPDPASLARPGFDLTHRFGKQESYQIEATLSPQYLPEQPTLAPDQNVQTTSVFGLFFSREWRY